MNKNIAIAVGTIAAIGGIIYVGYRKSRPAVEAIRKEAQVRTDEYVRKTNEFVQEMDASVKAFRQDLHDQQQSMFDRIVKEFEGNEIPEAIKADIASGRAAAVSYLRTGSDEDHARGLHFYRKVGDASLEVNSNRRNEAFARTFDETMAGIQDVRNRINEAKNQPRKPYRCFSFSEGAQRMLDEQRRQQGN